MDMTSFHELLLDESADDQLIIALRKMLEVKEPESVLEALQVKSLGSWSGWSF